MKQRLLTLATFTLISSLQLLQAMAPSLADDRLIELKKPELPLPAKVRLKVEVENQHAVLDAHVYFEERGYVIDWGKVTRREHLFWVETTVKQSHPESLLHPWVIEARNRYRLGVVEPGAYEVRFLINHHEYARTHFKVEAAYPGTATLRAGSLTHPGQTSHPFHVVFKHPSGVNPDSLGNGNLRVIGRHYETRAHFKKWEPVLDQHGHRTGLRAWYEAAAPGDVWTAADNGAYAVHLEPNSVKDGDGGTFPGQHLGVFLVAIEQETKPLPRFGALDIISLEIDNQTVYGALLTLGIPAGYRVHSWGEARRDDQVFHVKVSLEKDAHAELPRREQHRYLLGRLSPGHYGFVVHSGGEVIGGKRFTIEAELLPKAAVLAENITSPHSNPHRFQVMYSSPNGMDLESIRKAELGAGGPHDFQERALLLSLERLHRPPHDVVRGEYEVNPPRGGWQSSYNGHYFVHLPTGQIHDQRGLYLPGGRYAGFDVKIRPHPMPEEPAFDFVLRQDGDSYFAVLTFQPGGSGWVIEEWGETVHLKGLTFNVRAVIKPADQAPHPASLSRHYKLGELKPGIYGFVAHGSNGFTSRHSFRIGDGRMDQFEAWQSAARSIEPLSAERDEEWMLRHYAFGITPGQEEPPALVHPAVRRDSENQARFEIIYPELAGAVDLVYRIEISDDLKTWFSADGLFDTREVLGRDDGTQLRRVQMRDPLISLPFRFVRIRVELDLAHGVGPEQVLQPESLGGL